MFEWAKVSLMLRGAYNICIQPEKKLSANFASHQDIFIKLHEEYAAPLVSG